MPLSNFVTTTGGLVRYAPTSKRQVKVLYAEENQEDIFLFNRLLKRDQRTDYELICVKSLSECIDALNTDTFDLVLLELWLRDSRGIDTLANIVGLGVETPIIVLTGVEDEELGEVLIKMGAVDYLPKAQAKTLLLRTMAYALERHHLLQQLREKAMEDPLTHLLNRAAFLERLEFLIHQADRSGDKLVAAMLDLDGFKPINDQWGHHAGDEVLIAIAQRLKESLRRSDIVGRYGGDEFVVILTHYSDVRDVMAVLENELSLITQPIDVSLDGETHKLSVGASIGVTEWSPGEKPDQLLNRADEAMYKSKHQGKNRITFHLH